MRRAKKEGHSDRERSKRPLSGAAWGRARVGFEYQILGGGGGEGTGLAGGGRMHCRTRPELRSFPRVQMRDAVVVSVMIWFLLGRRPSRDLSARAGAWRDGPRGAVAFRTNRAISPVAIAHVFARLCVFPQHSRPGSSIVPASAQRSRGAPR